MHNKGTYTGSLGNLCRWLAGQAEELGVEIFPGFAAAEVLFDEDGAVKGVATGDMGVARDGTHKPDYQPGLELHAKYTFFAEGVRGHLTKEMIRTFDLREGQRSAGLWHRHQGTVGHRARQARPRPRDPHPGLAAQRDAGSNGGGLLYHQANGQVALGFVTWLNYTNPYLSPFQEMQRWKTHPAIAEILEGGKRVSYGARAISDGGLQSIPKLVFPGGALIGDSAGFLNVPRIKGTHTAMKIGDDGRRGGVRRGAGAARAHDELAAYPEAFEASWVKKELSIVRNVVPLVKKFGDLVGSGLAGVDDVAGELGREDALHDAPPSRPRDACGARTWSSRSPIPSPTAC